MGCHRNNRGCFTCYEPTLHTATAGFAPTVFLEFPYPANAIPLGGILDIRFTANTFNHSGVVVAPIISLNWGSNSFTFASGYLGTWASHLLAAPVIWGFEFMRQGNAADPTDPSGAFWLQQPKGFDPMVYPFYDPLTIPAESFDDIDFTVNQQVAMDINWTVGADATTKIVPITANVVSYGFGPGG